jgi:pimeloyl-ACP methyl ester carboxylesterase
MRYPRLPIRRRWLQVGISVALVLGAASATVAARDAMAVTPAASSAPASSQPTAAALIHRLRTCLPRGARRPTIVLIHGAWADTSSWNGEVALLLAAGYDARAIANPVQALATDSEYVADFVRTIRRPVVLVGHSYGGSVITNAAAGLSNVKALVYVDAAAPAPGQTTVQLSGAGSILNKLKPARLFFRTTYPGAPKGAAELYLRKDIFIRYFASDLPRSEAELLWATQRGASTAALGARSKAAAWRTIPSWYFISTGDQIITASSELAMARRAHSHITVFRGGSHLTLISHPNAVTAVIASAICSLR